MGVNVIFMGYVRGKKGLQKLAEIEGDDGFPVPREGESLVLRTADMAMAERVPAMVMGVGWSYSHKSRVVIVRVRITPLAGTVEFRDDLEKGELE